MAKNLVVFNRPAMKERGVTQPTYTPDQIKVRETISQQIAHILQENISDGGAFITPNNARDGMLVALTLPMPSLKFTTPDGNEQETRSWNLTLNALILKEGASDKPAADTEGEAHMSFEELSKLVGENRAAKKSAGKAK